MLQQMISAEHFRELLVYDELFGLTEHRPMGDEVVVDVEQQAKSQCQMRSLNRGKAKRG